MADSYTAAQYGQVQIFPLTTAYNIAAAVGPGDHHIPRFGGR